MKYIKLYEQFDKSIVDNDLFTYFSKLDRLNLIIFKYNKYKNLMFSIRDEKILKVQGLNPSVEINNYEKLESKVNELIEKIKSSLLDKDKEFKSKFPISYKLFKEFNNNYNDYFLYYLNSVNSGHESTFYPDAYSRGITTYYDGKSFPIYYSINGEFKFKDVKVFLNKTNEILLIDKESYVLNYMKDEKLYTLIKEKIN